MPGLSLVYWKRKEAAVDEARLRETLSILAHDNRYVIKTLHDENSVKILFNGYSDYPIDEFSIEDCSCFVDGKIYNASARDVCQQLCRALKSADPNVPTSIDTAGKDVLASCDGEFLIAIVDGRRGLTWIFADMLGQLPLYVSDQKDRTYLSREQKFITSLSNNHDPDKIAVAQYLMYGFSFRNRTLSRDLRRCPQAYWGVVDSRTGQFRDGLYYQWNLDQVVKSQKTVEEAAPEAADIFIDLLRTRAGTIGEFKPIVALSGGLDSRIILASLLKSRQDVTAISNLDDDRPIYNDFEIAKLAAAEFSIPFKGFHIRRPTWRDILTLMRRHEANSPAFMALAVPAIEHIFDEFGEKVVLLNGDGGNITMYPVEPSLRGQSLAEIMTQTLKITYYVSPNLAARLTGLHEEDVWNDIFQTLEDFPEHGARKKFAHYRMFYRALRFAMDAEDRPRYWCWSMSPMWGLDLFKYMISLPDKCKAHYGLYTSIMRRVDARTMRPPYAATKIRISMKSLPVYSRVNDFIHQNKVIYKPLRNLLVRHEQSNFKLEPQADANFRELVNDPTFGLEKYLDVDLLKKLLSDGQPRMSYYLLLSIVLKAALTNSNYRVPVSGN